MKQINIMTSCDDNLALHILPQLASISVNMQNQYSVDFFLFHYRISESNVNVLRKFAGLLGNINFHEIIMKEEDITKFEKLNRLGNGAVPVESYAFLNCHSQLPESVDRVLAIDAGDVIVHGDISEFYFDSFEGKSFIATPECFGVIDQNGEPRGFCKEDFNNPEYFKIMMSRFVNAGCIMLNVEKLRAECADIFNKFEKAVDYSFKLEHGLGKLESTPFFSNDQGLLTLTFIDDIKLYGYEINEPPRRRAAGYLHQLASLAQNITPQGAGN